MKFMKKLLKPKKIKVTAIIILIPNVWNLSFFYNNILFHFDQFIIIIKMIKKVCNQEIDKIGKKVVDILGQ